MNARNLNAFFYFARVNAVGIGHWWVSIDDSDAWDQYFDINRIASESCNANNRVYGNNQQITCGKVSVQLSLRRDSDARCNYHGIPSRGPDVDAVRRLLRN